ncbi:MAG: shikimate kinase [Christensenellaceae bacterium]|nr:shikimate kinase [Christensenellaceae bacterium]
MRNIVLIGMPGCGKSTVGVVLAKNLAMEFIDSDLVIQREMGMRLSELIDRYGDDGFREIENRVNSGIQAENSVIATGGSVVYGEEAMAHLKGIGTVVYLKLSYPQVEDRLGDLHARGVSVKPGQTLRDLYEERCPLYESWADIVVPCDGKRLREVVLYLTGKLTGEDA